jgi:beta-lactamase class A
MTPGFWITFRDALVQMIIVSDNTCTGTVVDMVGLGEIQRYCDAIGLTRTVHRFGIPPRLGPDHTLEQVTTTTPHDQGKLLEMILHGVDGQGGRGQAGLHARAVPPRPRHPLLAEAQDAPALAAAPRHQGRAQDGTGSRGFMDAGIIFKGEAPLFILTAYTEHVPAALPDGTPGFTAAYQVIGKMSRLAWDALGG